LLYRTNDEINVFTKSVMSSSGIPNETESFLATYNGISRQHSGKKSTITFQNQRKYKRVEPILSSEDELLSSDTKVENLVVRVVSIGKSVEVLRDKNRKTEKHLEACSRKINQFFKKLESKNCRNIDLEKKNNAIRSRVLTTCLEREVKKEMAENKRRWKLVQDVGDLEPDFTTHSWKQAKSIMSESMFTVERNLQFKDKISIKDDNLESCEGENDI